MIYKGPRPRIRQRLTGISNMALMTAWEKVPVGFPLTRLTQRSARGGNVGRDVGPGDKEVLDLINEAKAMKVPRMGDAI